MKLIDLTDTMPEKQKDAPICRKEIWDIANAREQVQAAVFRFAHDSMAGTYIDFPGHMVSTDDGVDAANCPPEALYRLDATLARLDRRDKPGAVTAEELASAAGEVTGQALIVHTLGPLRYDDVPERSIYFAREAAEWIVDSGVKLLVSDIYESNDHPQGVFSVLFGGGVSTICCPVNLHLLPAGPITVTALPLKFPGATQLPCRVIAETPA